MRRNPQHGACDLIPAKARTNCAKACLDFRRHRAKENSHEDPDSRGSCWLDYDLDGDMDLVIVNGHIYPQVDQTPELGESYRQLPILLRNDGGKLTDVSRGAGPGFQRAVSARGLAVGDFDDDGDLDLLITTMDGFALLMRNDSPRLGHWLKLRVLTRQGSPAINARALLVAGGRSQRIPSVALPLHHRGERPAMASVMAISTASRLAFGPILRWTSTRMASTLPPIPAAKSRPKQ
jgi:hypothetical protein